MRTCGFCGEHSRQEFDLSCVRNVQNRRILLGKVFAQMVEGLYVSAWSKGVGEGGGVMHVTRPPRLHKDHSTRRDEEEGLWKLDEVQPLGPFPRGLVFALGVMKDLPQCDGFWVGWFRQPTPFRTLLLS